ncbi:MAG: SDR family NAD(P)-dependent oxidoreductase, partial [Chloroflexi bacterium]|nr:SDR family NAD(P)-dependent oxidoreductase [Chloroflexota bacterium]
MREFAGNTAVVTGAASGMGLAFARRFAAEGMNVVLADIEEDALQTQVTRLQQEERNVLGVVVDTMRREALEHLRDRTIAEYGNVHILVNNAGVAGGEDSGVRPDGSVIGSWEISDETWNWIMGVNFWGVLYGIHVVAGNWLDQAARSAAWR